MISIVAALSRNRVIWKNNKLPWYYPEDLKHFRKLTINKTIVMWRKTFESIGNPLPERKNIVLTRNQNRTYPWTTSIHDIPSLIQKHRTSDKELMIIWGEQIYTLFLPHATTLYLTEIKKEFLGDVFFPEYHEFVEIERIVHDEYDFVTYSNFTSLSSTT